MKAIVDFTERIEKAYSVAEQGITSPDSLHRLLERKNALLASFEEYSYVKVPFVGDFSSGKSSIINSLFSLGDFLPTDITPETSVAYELWYSEGESLELWRDSTLLDTYPVSKIAELDVRPGDLVKVYLNNNQIKALNDKGIVIVDMPGIDSGIEAHTSAILNYIHQGTAFAIFTDIEEGTLRGTTVSFIKELKNYGVNMGVFITKADLKPTEEQEKVFETVSSLAKRMISDDVFVGITSAHQPLLADLESWLQTLSAEQLVKSKFTKSVDCYVQSIKDELSLTLSMLENGFVDYESQVQKITEAKNRKMAELADNENESQPIDGSVSDIMHDVGYALNASASKLATLIYGSDGENLDVNAELMNIIRPVIISSYKREMQEYQDFLDDGVLNFSVNIASILESVNGDKDVFDTVGNMIKDIIADVLPLFDIPRPLAKLIADQVTKHVPDILQVVFGKKKHEVIAEIKTKLIEELFPQILAELRPAVKESLEKSRLAALNDAKAKIEAEAKLLDDALLGIKEEMENNLSDFETKKTVITEALSQIDLI